MDPAQRTVLIKQLSRQLVHLRESRQHTREKIEEAMHTQGGGEELVQLRRLEADVERAIDRLQSRIKRLMTA